MKKIMLILCVLISGCAAPRHPEYYERVSDVPVPPCIQGNTYNKGPVDSTGDLLNEFGIKWK